MTFNEWWISLPVGRQLVLIEDKWMLADNAFQAGQVQKPEYQLYGYATPSGKLYRSSLEALQNGEQSFVKVYVNKEDLK